MAVVFVADGNPEQGLELSRYLSDKPGQLVSRQQILSACFPDCLDSSDRIIDTHIKNIRAKLGPSGMDWIETVRGYGYRFLGHDALV